MYHRYVAYCVNPANLRFVDCDQENLPTYFYDHDCEVGSEIMITQTPAPNVTYLFPRPTR